MHDDGLTGLEVGARAEQVPCGGALEHRGEGGAVARRVRDGEGECGVGDRLLGVATAREERDDTGAVRRPADDLGTGHEREHLARQVAVLRLVRVGVVDAGSGDVQHHETIALDGIGELHQLQDLGSAEASDLHGTHPSTLTGARTR